jgi:hypothetical protein
LLFCGGLSLRPLVKLKNNALLKTSYDRKIMRKNHIGL